jgi:hypothetical protein
MKVGGQCCSLKKNTHKKTTKEKQKQQQMTKLETQGKILLKLNIVVLVSIVKMNTVSELLARIIVFKVNEYYVYGMSI